MGEADIFVYVGFADRSLPFLGDVLEVYGAGGADISAGGAAELTVAVLEIQLWGEVWTWDNDPVRASGDTEEAVDAGLGECLLCSGRTQDRSFFAGKGEENACGEADDEGAQDMAAFLKGYRRHLLPPLDHTEPQRVLWTHINAGEAIDASALGDFAVYDGACGAGVSAGVALCAAVLG